MGSFLCIHAKRISVDASTRKVPCDMFQAGANIAFCVLQVSQELSVRLCVCARLETRKLHQDKRI